MKISVIGTGYVGLVSGVCFSELNNQVICVDIDEMKINALNKGIVPIHEPGLKELIEKNLKSGNLSFTSNIANAVQQTDIIIIAVGTPSLPSGEANLTYIKKAAIEIAKAMNKPKIIITKSTVPVGTNEKIAQYISENTIYSFNVASVPEFLREGSAIKDTMNPDRIIIGTGDDQVAQRLIELHKPLTEKIMVTDVRSAEMIKYASNAFLATKISFINEIANICEKVGANVDEVSLGMGMDKRIGPSFLKAGIGYGGSCFPKDTQALIQIAGQMNYDFKLLKSVVEVNNDQRFNVIRKLNAILGDLEGRTIGVWGLAFKPETDDVRDSPAIEIINALVNNGAKVRAYDPIATKKFMSVIENKHVIYCYTAQDAANNADALCILTEWREFRDISLGDIQKWLKHPILIDGRNIYQEEEVAETPFVYYSVGRPNLNNGIKEHFPIMAF